MSENTCVCLICLKPNDVWLEFLSSFHNYDVFVIVDDNSSIYDSRYINSKKINIIQINNDVCVNNGFINVNYLIFHRITGWEKALYYFSCINTNYKNVWFLEDDVFFYGEQTLLNIDAKYTDGDLLSNGLVEENKTGHKKTHPWRLMDIKIPPPYYHCMVCAVRMSQQLLFSIKDYAVKYKTLFFLEVLYPTICRHNKLKHHIVDELKRIVFGPVKLHELNVNTVNYTDLCHPVKDINKHIMYRTKLTKDKM